MLPARVVLGVALLAVGTAWLWWLRADRRRPPERRRWRQPDQRTLAWMSALTNVLLGLTLLLWSTQS
jgi:hypothetical protein